MTNIDRFESVFRSAAKPRFHREAVVIRKALVVTDLPEAEAVAFRDDVRSCVGVALNAEDPGQGQGQGEVTWEEVVGGQYSNVGELLSLVETHEPDLICTYRHLHSDGWQWPFSLGEYLDVLTQATPHPVLALPHPRADRRTRAGESAGSNHVMRNCDAVMAITDHLTGSDRLVNAALRFTQPGGTLWLTHVEDEVAYDRIMEVIGKIPSIDTDSARETIASQLLKEPTDFVRSCREVLQALEVDVEIQELVVMGHHLSAYRRLVGDHEVDLLVMNTKDEDQMAMHGMAYPLAVELRDIPLLLL